MYGIAPAQFRLQRPTLNPFPPENLWLNWRKPSMELMQCFENVRFMHKDAFYVVGLEVDIHYNSDDGTAPIAGLWDIWNSENLKQTIPNQVSPGTVYGMTHSENTENTAKYFVGVEVSTLDNLPVGLIGRKFGASEHAVFDTTLSIISTGDFWRTFHTKWLPNSGYALHDTQIRESFPTFNKHPDIEVYPDDCKDEQSIMQIYAPVVKNK